jgi:hypothetical protein
MGYFPRSLLVKAATTFDRSIPEMPTFRDMHLATIALADKLPMTLISICEANRIYSLDYQPAIAIANLCSWRYLFSGFAFIGIPNALLPDAST